MSSVFKGSWYDNSELKGRVENSILPSMLAHTNRSSPLFPNSRNNNNTASTTPTPWSKNSANASSSTSASASASGKVWSGASNNDNNNNKKKKDNRPASANETAKRLTSGDWREPFELLKRLEDRFHNQQIEAQRQEFGVGSSSSSSSHHHSQHHQHGKSSSSHAGRKFGDMISLSRKSQLGAGKGDENLLAKHFTAPRLDPMSEMDQLFSKAKRRWISLCVNMRVSEEERNLIERQLLQQSSRDEPHQMTTALQILHSEIERLVDLHKWTGILRDAILVREKLVTALVSFLTQFALNAKPLSDNNSSSSTTTKKSSTSSSSASAFLVQRPSSLGEQGEICLRVLSKLLELRHANAEVFTAHRKWQNAHVMTKPTPLFVFKGTPYLEKMVYNDLVSLVDTDALDVDIAIQKKIAASAADSAREERELKEQLQQQQQEQEENEENNDEEDEGNNKPNKKMKNNNTNLAVGSARDFAKKNKTQTSPTRRRSSSPLKSPSSSSNNSLTTTTTPQVIQKIPTWLFNFVLFRISKQNVLLDTRKRRIITHKEISLSSSSSSSSSRNNQQRRGTSSPKSRRAARPASPTLRSNNSRGRFSQERYQEDEGEEEAKTTQEEVIQQAIEDWEQDEVHLRSSNKQQTDQLLSSSDEKLHQLVSERLGWSIDEYFRSGSNALADVRLASKFAVEVLKKRVVETATNPSQLGTIHNEFLQELENNCAFVLDHERAIVDRLVETSVRGGAYRRENELEGAMVSEASTIFSLSNQPSQIDSIIRCQAAVRRFLASVSTKRLYEKKIAVTRIQAQIRRFRAERYVKNYLRRRWRAALKIQAFYRGCVIRRVMRADIASRREEKDRRLQKYVDAKQTKPDPNRLLIVADHAVQVSPPRKVLISLRKQETTLREYLNKCATLIQKIYRGHRVYHHREGLLVKDWQATLAIHRAAALIQALVRGVFVRKEYNCIRRLLQVVKVMQRVGRGFLARSGREVK